MRFFITRPEHDDATFYLSAWSKELIELAKEKGFAVFDLNKQRANADAVSEVLAKKPPKLVVFNGHGSEDTIMGHNDEVLIKSGKNEELLKEKIVFCRSCNSAAKLGKDSVQSGAIAFIGYNDLFGFPLNPQMAANPLQDEFAKPCLEASNQIVKSLLKGNSVAEADNSSQAVADNWMQKMQRSNAPPEAPHIMLWLLWNKGHQQVHGNSDAKL